MRWARPLLFAAATIHAQTSAPASPEVKALKAQVSLLRQELDNTNKRIDELSSAVSDHTFELVALKNEEVILDPAKPDQFQVVTASGVPMLVSLGKTEPYLDGYKLIIQLGNLSAMTITRAKAKIRWAPRIGSLPKGTNWAKTIRDTELILNELQSRYWNHREVILANTKSSDCGWISVSIEISQVGLR